VTHSARSHQLTDHDSISKSPLAVIFFFFLLPPPPPPLPLFPYTTLFRSAARPPAGMCPLPRRPRAPPLETGTLRSEPRLPQQGRSEEHTSELQSPCNLVCRLLLEKKNKTFNCTLSAPAVLLYPLPI